jgi:hypothetical protein
VISRCRSALAVRHIPTSATFLLQFFAQNGANSFRPLLSILRNKDAIVSVRPCLTLFTRLCKIESEYAAFLQLSLVKPAISKTAEVRNMAEEMKNDA